MDLPKTYQACIEADKAERTLSEKQWAIGDALVEELGPVCSGRKRRNTGLGTKLAALSETLNDEGILCSVATLISYRRTASIFPLVKRITSLHFNIHSEAGSPNMLKRILERNPQPTSRDVIYWRKYFAEEDAGKQENEIITELELKELEDKAKAKAKVKTITNAEVEANKIITDAEAKAAEIVNNEATLKDAKAEAARILAEAKKAEDTARQTAKDIETIAKAKIKTKIKALATKASKKAAKIIEDAQAKAATIVKEAEAGPRLTLIETPKPKPLVRGPLYTDGDTVFQEASKSATKAAIDITDLRNTIPYFNLMTPKNIEFILTLVVDLDGTITEAKQQLQGLKTARTKGPRLVEINGDALPQQ